MDVGAAVSNRELAMVWVINRMTQNWVEGQIDEARRLELLLSKIETMSDEEFDD